MQITSEQNGDVLELALAGMLDNESAVHLRDTVDKVVSQGQHRILVDLAGLKYVSSAGIAMLLHCRQQLAAIQGVFGVYGAQSQVAEVLRLTKVDLKLSCDPEMVRATAGATGSMTQRTMNRVASQAGIDIEIYDLAAHAKLSCRVCGTPQPMFDAKFTPEQVQAVSFPASTFGLGLGAFGADFDECRDRFGEFLAAAGGAAQLPTSGFATPDYLLETESYIPSVNVIYGVQCTGAFANLLRFEPGEETVAIPLSTLVEQCLQLTEAQAAGMVLLAECNGLVGAALRRSPALTADGGRFEHPEVRDWISYSGEQVHRHSLVLIAGVAVCGKPEGTTAALTSVLRPMREDDLLYGHFHAAVFPYRPLKKRSLDLELSVHSLFDSGALEDVMHLLCDRRPIVGAGETELLGGGCWISPLSEIVKE